MPRSEREVRELVASEQKQNDLVLRSEDVTPKGLAERYLNNCVLAVQDLEVRLRQAKSNERRARAELARLTPSS